MGLKTEHKQVEISHNGVTTKVDEGLAPLLLAIWEKGIDTCLSCQENFPGIAWIMFTTAFDAERFLNLVFVYNRKKPFWETISVSIRFPITDIPLIMKRLKRHEIR